ncbi:DUF21 domain-containing protein [Candidatus Woesearchaeota archaeon]|nr:DUF21 domain-containing protein [Candidatus Woesearchaeota archaeon]
MLWIWIIVLVVLIFFSGFFSGVETALISLNMFKVKALVKQKKKGAEVLYRLKKDPHRLITTVLVGNNLVNVSAAAIATYLFTDLFGSAGIGIATGVMTFIILVFGEIIPKTFASENAERISLSVARPIELLCYVLTPFTIFSDFISRKMSKVLGSKKEKQLSEEELKTIVTMGKEEGILSREAADMIHNVLKFEGTKVTKIMTPDVNVDMIDGEKTIKQISDYVINKDFSKYPVYEGDKDNIIGILDVDDLLKYVKGNKIFMKVKEIVKKAYFVPESKEIDDLLTEFEGKDMQVAVVVDEYGHVVGLVTIEDIMEEIVGEIFDKSKKPSAYIKKLSDTEIIVDAMAPVDEINEALKIKLTEKYANTIGGFIEHLLKRIPKEGESISFKNIKMKIEKATAQGVKSVKIIKG